MQMFSSLGILTHITLEDHDSSMKVPSPVLSMIPQETYLLCHFQLNFVIDG